MGREETQAASSREDATSHLPGGLDPFLEPPHVAPVGELTHINRIPVVPHTLTPDRAHTTAAT